MLKEYINELVGENDEKLKDLEHQMRHHLDELDCAKEWLETLQEQKNIDKNIFSPRTIDTNLKEKTEEARNNIRKIELDIEHVRAFIEEQLKKKEEYEKLLDELENFSDNVPSEEAPAEENRSEMIASSEEDVTDDRSKEILSRLLDQFLPDIFRKTELCLALLSSDRVKCKNELKSMKTMIKNMADELKDNLNES